MFSNLKPLLRRLYLSIKSPHRIVVLDYPVEPKPLYDNHKPHKTLFDLISKNDTQYAELLNGVNNHASNLQLIKAANEDKNPIDPTWNNNYVPGLDIVLLYTILNRFKPKK